MPPPTAGDRLLSGMRAFQRTTAPLVREQLARLAREGRPALDRIRQPDAPPGPLPRARSPAAPAAELTDRPAVDDVERLALVDGRSRSTTWGRTPACRAA